MCTPERILVLALALGAPLPCAAFISCGGLGASLNAGEYESGSSVPLDASSVFRVACARHGGVPNASVTVSLGPSATTGTVARRAMRRGGGTDLLAYNLYADASRAQVWGDTPGANTVTRTLDLANKSAAVLTFPIFSRVDALQDVRVGTYTDTVTINVDF